MSDQLNTPVPVSEARLKRLSKELRGGGTHFDGLNLAAQQFGWNSYNHYKNSHANAALADSVSATAESARDNWYTIQIEVGWWNGTTGGVEQHSVQLSRTLREVVPPRGFAGRHFGAFRRRGDSTVVLDRKYLQRQETAQQYAAVVSRTLIFADVTGLIAKDLTSRSYPKSRSEYSGRLQVARIPFEDHVSIWQCPATKKLLIVDEPYADDRAEFINQRQEWCSRHGYQMAKSPWPGMHNPPDSKMWLFSKEMDLSPIIAKLASLVSFIK